MTSWRPAPYVRFKALGLHWRNGRLLAAQVRDDAGQLTGLRPLGGTVEFGETAKDAVKREFREELGIDILVGNNPFFMENIYSHEGTMGHEVLAVFDVEFPKDAFASVSQIAFTEDNGTACIAEWVSLDSLDLDGGPKLFPEGLKMLLRPTG